MGIRQKKVGLILLVMIGGSVLYYLLAIKPLSPSSSFLLLVDDKNVTRISSPPTIKRILIWTASYFGIAPNHLGFGEGQSVFINAGCEVSNCWTTQDRSWLNRSDAVVFHGAPGDFNVSDLPKERWPHQRYIYLNYEALSEEEILGIPGNPNYYVFEKSPPHFFNWTMSQRRDSDVFHPLHYGLLRRIKGRKTSSTAADAGDETMPGPLAPGQLPSAFVGVERESLWHSSFMKNKTNLLAWFVSNCPTTSKREEYVKELARHIQVDIYGKCGNLSCLPHNSEECGARVMSRYKFYFSAENNLCPDYISEKFYRALVHGAVPVVYGGADYNAYAPPGSYIHVSDFRTPKDLASYLLLLDSNDALYLSYFNWKKKWEVVRPWFGGFCNLCRKLNDPTEPAKSYANLSTWWFQTAPCYPSTLFLKKLLNSLPIL